jgi:signal peptidase I
MHPTLQMGWRVFLEPARGEDLRVGEIAVFRGPRYLTIHRLVYRETGAGGTTLVFRGDYNRLRERIAPDAVVGRVVAIEVPGQKRAAVRVELLKPDILARFYRLSQGAARLLWPLLPRILPEDRAPGPFGRGARAIFSWTERLLSLLLPQRR